MLPTPDTSHVPANLVYEPSEDSYLILDTLSSESERAFLRQRFPTRTNLSSPADRSSSSPREVAVGGAPGGERPDVTTPAPLALEVGTGSGVVSAFLAAHAA